MDDDTVCSSRLFAFGKRAVKSVLSTYMERINQDGVKVAREEGGICSA